MKERTKNKFCVNGHEIAIVGRRKCGTCIQCDRERNRVNPSQDSRIKDICINGHLILEVGRDQKHNCLGCARQKRIDPNKDSRIKQFCPMGHNKDVVGRTQNNKCVGCEKLRRINPIKDSRLKQFCIKGHNTLEFGRTKSGYCRKCWNDYDKIYRDGHKEKAFDRRLRRSYGISSEDYNSMFAEQLGCCLICLKPQSNFKKRLAVDHDHKTGKIRGLLCDNCNKALGNVFDNSNLLRMLANYIDKNKEIQNGN